MEFTGASDIWNLFYIPLMVMTVISARKNWKELIDDRLTVQDRHLLLRIALFLLLPVVVFFHEVGHAVAIVLFGGKVAEFHFGVMWGFVKSYSQFTPSEHVWIAFAGNLVEMLIGMASLGLAVVSKAPPLVAVSTYLGILSVGGAAVLYPLMSVTGCYGDWVQIYDSPAHVLVFGIGLFHGAVVALLFWGLFAPAPKMWFAAATDPAWAKSHAAVEAACERDPSFANLLAMGWSYFQGGLLSRAKAAAAAADSVAPGSPQTLMLRASIALRANSIEQAVSLFENVASQEGVHPRLAVEALLCLGDCKLNGNNPEAALKCYERALGIMPEMADLHFLKGLTLNMLGKHSAAESELSCLDDPALFWRNISLREQVGEQLAQATKGSGAKA